MLTIFRIQQVVIMGEACVYEIEFYDTEDGTYPIKEFLDSLEPKIQAKVLRMLDLLEISPTV